MKTRFYWKFVLIFIFSTNISQAVSFNVSDLNIVNNLIKQYLQTKFNSSNPYKDQIAYVRKSPHLSLEEQAVVSKRLIVNNLALAKFLNMDSLDNKELRIGMCASGGGYRATIGTLGSLLGAQEIGLLDCVTYIAGLSGSTWAMAAWLSLNQKLSDTQYQISKNMSENIHVCSNEGILNIDHDQYSGIIKDLITKKVFDQPLCSVDLWGAAILDNLFYPNENRQNLKLSEQVDVIKDGNVPFPIYTSIQPISKLNYQWYEFTPYECGNIKEQSFVPTWAFGRQFENGKSLNNAPEQNLSFLLGIFGSAYDVTPEELCSKLSIEEKFKNFLNSTFSFLPKVMLNKLIKLEEYLSDLKNEKLLYQNYCDDRFLPAQVSNINYLIQDTPCNDQQNVVLMDAGIDFNLPFPPLLRPERSLDVIIALDYSSDIIGCPELMGAQSYASKNALKFPAINSVGVANNSLTVYGLETFPDNPIVIYMPRINPIKTMTEDEIAKLIIKVDPKYIPLIETLRSFDYEACVNSLYCSTYNFAYSDEQINILSGVAYLNMIINKDVIADIFKLALAKKYMPYFKMPTSTWICR
ncbi:MAG: hypothetical protein P4L22_06840 [Candidatus Babeliales bacterium]|nr:hypothetical protein [Candidatus Babeliales bacterium]